MSLFKKLIPFCLLSSFLLFAGNDQLLAKEKIKNFTQDNNFDREVVYNCYLTKQTKHFLKKPVHFNRSNNLMRKVKDVFRAQGNEIILEGYVLDHNCVPITNASLQIWQTNAHGVNQQWIKKDDLRKDTNKLYEYDPYFASNGSNSSDNTGFYRFIALKPCESCEKIIDLSARHQKFQGLDAMIKFDLIRRKNDKPIKKNGSTIHQNVISKKDGKLECLSNSYEDYHIVEEDEDCKGIYGANSSIDKRIEKYSNILGKGKKLPLKQELKILCDEQSNQCSNNVLIKRGDAIAKFIGVRNGKDVYRLDIVLKGADKYRKY